MNEFEWFDHWCEQHSHQLDKKDYLLFMEGDLMQALLADGRFIVSHGAGLTEVSVVRTKGMKNECTRCSTSELAPTGELGYANVRVTHEMKTYGYRIVAFALFLLAGTTYAGQIAWPEDERPNPITEWWINLRYQCEGASRVSLVVAGIVVVGLAWSVISALRFHRRNQELRKRRAELEQATAPYSEPAARPPQG